MSQATWFYLSKTWFRRTRKIGPISERELLVRIDRGVIEPSTLLQSVKTKDRWVPMQKVGPAMQRYQKLHPEMSSKLAAS